MQFIRCRKQCLFEQTRIWSACTIFVFGGNTNSFLKTVFFKLFLSFPVFFGQMETPSLLLLLLITYFKYFYCIITSTNYRRNCSQHFTLAKKSIEVTSMYRRGLLKNCYSPVQTRLIFYCNSRNKKKCENRRPAAK